MTRIERHAIDIERAREKAAFFDEEVRDSMQHAAHFVADLNDAHHLASAHAGYCSALADTASVKQVRASLRISAQAGLALQKIALTDTGDVDLVVGQPMTLTATGPNGYTNPALWIKSFYAAMIVRNRNLLDELCAIPASIFATAETRYDSYLPLWVEALRSFWLSRDDVFTRINEALKATGPKDLHATSTRAALLLWVPPMTMLFALTEHDAPAFNTAFAQSLESHKKYFSTTDKATEPAGFLAHGPLALACAAHDLGIPITVRSGYAPAYALTNIWTAHNSPDSPARTTEELR